MSLPRFDFWDGDAGAWRYEVPTEKWVHAGVTIVLLVVEDTGRTRRGAPPYYVRQLRTRFNSLEEAKRAIEDQAAKAR